MGAHLVSLPFRMIDLLEQSRQPTIRNTSQTDPLRVEGVKANTLDGVIGMSLCLGKFIDSNIFAEWQRPWKLSTLAAGIMLWVAGSFHFRVRQSGLDF